MKKSILLTGATGFLGKDLLYRLLAEGHHVYLLLREKRGYSVQERVQSILERKFHRHVSVINGDITKINLGLSETELASLRGKIDVVIHSAGLVFFDEALKEELYDVNLNGTKKLLSFAKKIAAPNFYYISTAYTTGKNTIAAEQLHPETTSFHNPYEQSKYLAEYSVIEAQDQNFHTAIFRPSIIIGDSQSGAADTSFTLYGYLRGLQLFHRKFGENLKGKTVRIIGDLCGKLNFVPVDYVCNGIIAALRQHVQTGIYHLTSSTPYSTQFVFSHVLQLLNIRDYTIQLTKNITIEDLTREEKILHSFVATYQDYLHHYADFDDSHMKAILKKEGIPFLKTTEEMFTFIVKTYVKNQLESISVN